MIARAIEEGGRKHGGGGEAGEGGRTGGARARVGPWGGVSEQSPWRDVRMPPA